MLGVPTPAVTLALPEGFDARFSLLERAVVLLARSLQHLTTPTPAQPLLQVPLIDDAFVTVKKSRNDGGHPVPSSSVSGALDNPDHTGDMDADCGEGGAPDDGGMLPGQEELPHVEASEPSVVLPFVAKRQETVF